MTPKRKHFIHCVNNWTLNCFFRCLRKIFSNIPSKSCCEQNVKEYQSNCCKNKKVNPKLRYICPILRESCKVNKNFEFEPTEQKSGEHTSLIRQKGKSQNSGYRKTKHAKFSEKRTFLTRWYVHRKIWHALFFCNHRFKIRPSALLPKLCMWNYVG